VAQRGATTKRGNSPNRPKSGREIRHMSHEGSGTRHASGKRMRVRRAVVAVLLTTVVTLGSREVAACSCEAFSLASPRQGATDVPLNAVVVFISPTANVVVYDVTHDVAVPASVESFVGRAVRLRRAIPAFSSSRCAPSRSVVFRKPRRCLSFDATAIPIGSP
jgi:hypothetical protein